MNLTDHQLDIAARAYAIIQRHTRETPISEIDLGVALQVEESCGCRWFNDKLIVLMANGKARRIKRESVRRRAREAILWAKELQRRDPVNYPHPIEPGPRGVYCARSKEDRDAGLAFARGLALPILKTAYAPQHDPKQIEA